jgi:predicted transcriptional regulator
MRRVGVGLTGHGTTSTCEQEGSAPAHHRGWAGCLGPHPVLEVRAFDDPTSAMQASVKALRQPQGPTRAISVATARELLTDQRVHLLRVIRKERPASVAELARLVGRTAEAVKDDLELLERAGVVSLESPSAKSQVRVPRVACDRVEIRLEL